MIVNGYRIAPRANLHGADLRGANLSRANLQGVNLHDTDLRWADLSRANLKQANLYATNLGDAKLEGANLHGADLYSANLHGANLYKADLSRADLRWANLSWADLRQADLHKANLHQTNFREADLHGAKNIPDSVLAQTIITPDGAIIGWKKCRGEIIVKLSIPADARRSNATGRKCRAEFADVLEVIGADEAVSKYDKTLVYKRGDRMEADTWEEDRFMECAGGIHFFLTRQEAEEYRP
jgi:hypothetical protein